MAHNSFGMQNEWVSRFATPASRLTNTQVKCGHGKLTSDVLGHLARNGVTESDLAALAVNDRNDLLRQARMELLRR